MVSLYIISSAKQNNNDNNRDISIWSHEKTYISGDNLSGLQMKQ